MNEIFRLRAMNKDGEHYHSSTDQKKPYRKMFFENIWNVIAIVSVLIVFYNLFDFKKQIVKKKQVNATKNPAIVWYTEMYDDWIPKEPYTINCSVGHIKVQCDIYQASKHNGKPDGYIFNALFIKDLPLPRDRKILWGLMHDESPIAKQEFMHEVMLNLFNFSLTFSRYSDVPTPLFWMRSIEMITSLKYFVKTKIKNLFLTRTDAIAPVLYIQSNCNTSTDRDAYVKALMEYINIDSYGHCLTNRFVKNADFFARDDDDKMYLNHLEDDDMYSFIAKYKFIIAIENGVCNDYVTEKLWRAIHVGTVPIYYGSPVIRDWLPNNKSAILIEDFPTPELMSKHLHELLDNDTMYEEYLEHKTKGLVSNRRIYEEMEARPTQTNIFINIDKLYCVMCERLHENSSRVNIVTKKHYDCPVPTSALTQSVNPNNMYFKEIRKAKIRLDKLFRNVLIRETSSSSSQLITSPPRGTSLP